MRASRPQRCASFAVRALANGALLDDDTSDGLPYNLAVWALTLAEDIQMAELAVTAAIEDARRRGSVLGFATACHLRATAVLRRGRVDGAAADAGNALAARVHGWGLSPAGATVALMRNPERFTPGEWEGDTTSSFRVEIQVDGWDRHRLLEDLSRTFAETGINILEANCTVFHPMVKNRFVVEVGDTQSLKACITRIRNIESVFDAYRVTPTG
jgi:predicted amino acid-binding ACT domain protein